jgi:hypothetical protein
MPTECYAEQFNFGIVEGRTVLVFSVCFGTEQGTRSKSNYHPIANSGGVPIGAG